MRRGIRATLVIGLFVLGSGCGDDDPAPDPTADPEDSGATDAAGLDPPQPPADTNPPDAGPPPPPQPSLEAGATRVVLTAEGQLELRHAGDVRLRLPPDAFELGTVPELDPARSYDPYYFEPEAELATLHAAQAGLEWHRATSITAEDGPEDSLSLTLVFAGGRTGHLSVSTPGDSRLVFAWTAGDGDPAAYFRLRARADPGEAFYGLGGVLDHPEHRGRVRAMHFAASLLESAYNEAHVPIPLLIGTRGWGLFVESMRPAVFAVATEADDLVKATFGQGAAWAEGLRFHLFTADHPIDITRHYYETTGYPALPAPWATGPLIWRDEVAGQAAVEADLQMIRDLDLATNGYWIDRPYASGVNSFDFAPADYTDPAAMITLAHDLGFEVALWHTPYLDPKHPATQALNAEAVEEGYYPPKTGAASKWGPSIDLTNPDARAFWQGQVKAYTDLGVRGFKLDFAEEHIPGFFGVRSPWLFHDGSDELTMHRRFQRLYHDTYRELLGDAGGLLLVRASVYGDQVNGVIVWPGDIDATMNPNGFEVDSPDGDSYISVGGLPAAIVAGSSLGPSGFPFFGSDTGGYLHSPPDKETYIRWFEHTALSTCMQVGTNTNDLPWALGKPPLLDPEVLDLYRGYARLHLRLFPYLWTSAHRIASTGRPIQRPLGLAYPELDVHPPHTYLLGDDLLVAPVVTPGATTRQLHLPPGRWLDWWTSAPHDGPGPIEVAAPLGTLPLFVRAGAPIPLLRPTIDTLSPVAAGSDVDSFDSSAGPLTIRTTPGVDSGSAPRQDTLYDGTVITTSIESPSCPLRQTVAVEPGEVFDTGEVLIAMHYGAEQSPTAVEVAGSPLEELEDEAAFESASAGWLQSPGVEGEPGYVRVKPGAGLLQATITLAEPGCP